MKRKNNWKLPAGEYYDIFADAVQQPHLLIAGASGSGKSVIINGLISTLLYQSPEAVQFILVDPKRVELAAYKWIPHTLYHAAGFDPETWADALEYAVNVMDDRYIAMENRREKTYSGGDVYVIIDELANVITNDLKGKPCNKAIQRLSCEGRAAKIHLIVATQTPKAEILPTRIRCNLDWKFALRTDKASDSRIIMDCNGCENLPRYGLGYYCKPGERTLYEIPMVPQKELDRLVFHWERQRRK